MKIVAVVDVHPLGSGGSRGLFARVAKRGGHFDLPITREQAGILLTNVETLMEPTPPEEEEDENLFPQFAAEAFASGDEHRIAGEYYEDDEL